VRSVQTPFATIHKWDGWDNLFSTVPVNGLQANICRRQHAGAAGEPGAGGLCRAGQPPLVRQRDQRAILWQRERCGRHLANGAQNLRA
jgi:hypothetical protein